MMGRKRSSAASTIEFARVEPALALRLEREVDHHDGVLLDDAHQQHDADQRHQRQIEAHDHQREQRADAGRRQRRQDREGVDEAFVEHAEHDVDGHDGGEDQPRLARQRVGEFVGVAEEAAGNRRRHADRLSRPSRRALTASLSAAPGARLKLMVSDGKLILVADRKRRGRVDDLGDGRERHLRAGGRRHVEPRRGAKDRCGIAAAPRARRDTGWPARRWSRPGAGRRRRSAHR